jgi:hypothetical protein
VNDPVCVFPAASVAEQFTVVVPIANRVPEAGVQPTDPGTTPEPPVSVALAAVYVTVAPAGPVAFTDTFADMVSTGLVLSTITVTDADPVFPFASAQVAFTVTDDPSPEETVVSGQLLGLDAVSGAPSAPGAQFQVTVTSELFQPAAFATGDFVGAATGTHAATGTVLP